MGGGYVEFNNGLFRKEALKELRPDLFSIRADTGYKIDTNFGTQFPKIARKGDLFVRVDVLPNRVFKFDGKKWLQQSKEVTTSYLDKGYLDFLIAKIGTGEYDLDLLSENEKMELEQYIKGTQNN